MKEMEMFIAKKESNNIGKRHPIKVYYLSSTGPLSIYATYYRTYISMRGSRAGKKEKNVFKNIIKTTYSEYKTQHCQVTKEKDEKKIKALR